MRCRDRKRSPAPQRGVWGECGARQREGARAGATGYTASRLDLSVAIQVLDTSPYRAGQPHARHQLRANVVNPANPAQAQLALFGAKVLQGVTV